MWEFIKSFAEWPLWNFLSVVLIVWITQRVIAWREYRKKIDDVKLELYMSIVRSVSDFYAVALDPPQDPKQVLELQRKGWETAARLSILGAPGVMESFGELLVYVMSLVAEKKPAEDASIRELASRVTYAICCDIHGEKFKTCSPSHPRRYAR